TLSDNSIRISVSVSTSGSKGVQRCGGYIHEKDAMSFSIHKRIEGGATFLPAGICLYSRRFQYPQADRRGCNKRKTHELFKNKNVSVSTSGSKGVQQPFFARFLAAFSLSAQFRAVLQPFFCF
ncbi:MAG: hypothetical protein ACOYXO_11865, partial [Chloroflexota bacterium]